MGLLNKMKEAANSISEAAKKTGNEVALASKRVTDKFSDFKVEDITNHLQTYEKYFSESDLWNKLTTYSKTIGATILYPVLLLFNLFKSTEIGLSDKAIIIGTLGYFILPLDLIPDSIPGAGYTDDATALMAAAGKGHADIARLLIEKGANVGAAANKVSKCISWNASMGLYGTSSGTVSDCYTKSESESS